MGKKEGGAKVVGGDCVREIISVCFFKGAGAVCRSFDCPKFNFPPIFCLGIKHSIITHGLFCQVVAHGGGSDDAYF